MWRSAPGLLVLAAALAAGGCGRNLDSEATESIRSAGQYEAVLAQVQKDTAKPLEMVELGEPLGEAELSKVHGALPKARGLVVFAPTAFGPRVLLAKLYRAANRPDEALEEYEKAVVLVPLHMNGAQAAVAAACHADMGGIHFGRREFKPAEDSLREALRLSPNSVVFRINLVQVLLESRQKDEARKVLAEAEKLNPKSQGVRAMKTLLGREESSSSPPKSGGTGAGSF